MTNDDVINEIIHIKIKTAMLPINCNRREQRAFIHLFLGLKASDISSEMKPVYDENCLIGI